MLDFHLKPIIFFTQIKKFTMSVKLKFSSFDLLARYLTISFELGQTHIFFSLRMEQQKWIHDKRKATHLIHVRDQSRELNRRREFENDNFEEEV